VKQQHVTIFDSRFAPFFAQPAYSSLICHSDNFPM
jgi:hypothetical protein